MNKRKSCVAWRHCRFRFLGRVSLLCFTWFLLLLDGQADICHILGGVEGGIKGGWGLWDRTDWAWEFGLIEGRAQGRLMINVKDKLEASWWETQGLRLKVEVNVCVWLLQLQRGKEGSVEAGSCDAKISNHHHSDCCDAHVCKCVRCYSVFCLVCSLPADLRPCWCIVEPQM